MAEEEGNTKEEQLNEMLRGLCHDAYWYGEETGDYDMVHIHEEPFFVAAYNTILNLKENRDG